ncbi:GlxA family transcriptional regulator [Frischella perrara]|uniref:GlxA family transcriptional regulator n=1 Tax=Frischella perrara TaxID=1267021 RepID=UPI0023F1F943|nr:helix-turn-helix domain-containing protein [Frischella perrara]
MNLPCIALVLYPNISPFHFSIPYMIFNLEVEERKLFDLKIVSIENKKHETQNVMTIKSDGGLELLEKADIIMIPGWHDLTKPPKPCLANAIYQAYIRGAQIVGLCYGTYALAYTGILDGKKASTHWMAEIDFKKRFPKITLDNNALYVEDHHVITSAGTAASLDCCLYIVRKIYGGKIANKIARVMVAPPHREGGQAQYIEHPIVMAVHNKQINALLDNLRKNLTKSYTIDELAKKASMSRSTFTRHFKKETGMTLVGWLTNERLLRSKELLETSSLSIEKIAELSGFQNTTSFRQYFKNRYQVSPNVWRRTFS